MITTPVIIIGQEIDFFHYTAVSSSYIKRDILFSNDASIAANSLPFSAKCWGEISSTDRNTIRNCFQAASSHAKSNATVVNENSWGSQLRQKRHCSTNKQVIQAKFFIYTYIHKQKRKLHGNTLTLLAHSSRYAVQKRHIQPYIYSALQLNYLANTRSWALIDIGSGGKFTVPCAICRYVAKVLY